MFPERRGIKARKATREQLRLHNRQLLLRAICYGTADNRAALALETGLAKPTVSDLTAELIAEGLLVESGRGESTDSGGKRPTLIKFVPNARQVIGAAVDEERAAAVLCNLAGEVLAEHEADLNGEKGEAAIRLLEEAINGLIVQLDAALLCIGVGVPGVVNMETGTVRQSSYLGWQDIHLTERLVARYAVPVYVSNRTELATLAQVAFGSQAKSDSSNWVTVLVNSAIEIGVAWAGAAYHHGGDIGSLAPYGMRLDSLLSWEHVQQRLRELGEQPFNGKLTYVHIQYAAANGDASALAVMDELAAVLAQVFAWSIGFLHPDHLSLVGEIVDLGEAFLAQIVEKTHELIAPTLVDDVVFSLATVPQISAVGAAALAIQQELGLI